MKFHIQHYRKLPSTNRLALEQAIQNAAEGLVIVADYQTRGHGKLNRKWVSPPGKNLLFSVLLRPPMSPSQAPILTQIACRSVAKVLQSRYKIESTFKRPNDILVHGRKICGILVEASSSTKYRLDFAVVGIGLNVNSSSHELITEAISIRDIKGKSYSRNTLLKAILKQFQNDLGKIYGNSREEVLINEKIS
ncbi:MAG: biotin--[acetyl-CoA-carboxylase] ligase [Candidatus Omnitrophica bacterium]|nr:biotin--[acetyl-CoA-carboxylase] ligase [Candidatus Omnitrophota bacterium]MDD5670094.1 biotin--[acetyl-CoA-carboxylase] ligase [Candidatus Omnitrophota bacterium]